MNYEQKAFSEFKFQLGDMVRHRATEVEGVITHRILVQAQQGNTGHAYMVNFSPGAYVKVLEVELEAVDAEEG